MDLIDGNAKSFSRILNDDARMEQLKSWNRFQASMALLRAEKDRKKEEKAEEARKKAEAKAEKKRAQEAAEKKRREELMPGLDADLARGRGHISSLSVNRLKDILVCKFNKKKSDVNKMKKGQLQEEVFSLMDA